MNSPMKLEGRICTVTRKRSPEGTSEYCVETGDDKSHFRDLTAEEQKKVLTWLYYNVLPAKAVLYGHTSYGMKHLLEDRTKIYMTNNQFKEAMLLCGFFPAVMDELNWNFRIRKSSPIFQRQVDGKQGLPMMGDPMDYSDRWSSKRYYDGRYVIEPTEAETVRRIYREYLSGKGTTAIANGLNADGVPTRLGGIWHKSAVMKILKNYTYTGNLLLQKTYREDYIVNSGCGSEQVFDCQFQFAEFAH